MLLTFHLNWWAILVAVVINMAVGALWYSPLLFGKTWSKLLNKKMSDMQKNAGLGYSASTIVALLQAFVLSNIIVDASITTARDGLLIGLLVWLGFVAATSLPDTIFSGRPKMLWSINSTYYLLVLLVNGAILAVWH